MATFSLHGYSLCTPTTANLKTPLSSSWSLQMTPHSSSPSRTVMSLPRDRRLRSWCSLKNLKLNTLKTVEMIVEFKRNPPALPQLTIMNSTITTVESFILQGTTISQELKWHTHFESIVKKAQQRLDFLRPLRKFNLSQELLKQFYSAIIESVLCTSITVWFSSATRIWPQKTTEGNPPYSPRTVFIQSEQKCWQNYSGPLTSSTVPLWTVATWSTLQSYEHQNGQAQEQFLLSDNTSYEHLTIIVEHNTLILLYTYLANTHT